MRVQHPAFSEIFRDVDDDKASEALAAGWLECSAEVDGQVPLTDLPAPKPRARKAAKKSPK